MRSAFLGVVLGCVALLTLTGCSDSSGPLPDSNEGTAEADASTAEFGAPFVGTWKLVAVERRSPDGEVLATPATDSLGYLMYDPAGYMGVVIQRADRQPYVGETRTPEEALAALTSYTSYFGTYTVDEAASTVTHHLEGSLNPSGAGSDYLRSYEFGSHTLTLQPPTGPSGVEVRLTWERVEDKADLSAEHRRFIGFWRFVKLERHTEDGEQLPVTRGFQNGFIIYTSSGEMAVHLMRPDREPYTGPRPTAGEAEAAMSTYASYFGPFTIHEEDGYVVHHRIGSTNPGTTGSDAQRFYELSDTHLILKPPPATIDGARVQSSLTWERLTQESR